MTGFSLFTLKITVLKMFSTKVDNKLIKSDLLVVWVFKQRATFLLIEVC